MPATIPIGAVPVTMPGTLSRDTGETCFVPDAFADDARRLIVSLDWARAHNTSQAYGPLQSELMAAARVARKIADDCETFARAAFEAER